jgi:hypothetical protein
MEGGAAVGPSWAEFGRLVRVSSIFFFFFSFLFKNINKYIFK